MYCMYESTESFKPFQLFSCVSEQINAEAIPLRPFWPRIQSVAQASWLGVRRAEGQKALTERGWSMMSESPCPVTTCHNL